MTNPNFMIVYVDSPAASGEFYRALLGREPVEASPTFIMFALDSGLMLGLWSRHTVQPAASAAGGGAELAFPVAAPQAVDEAHARWQALGVPILLAPTDLEFGRSFVGVDPDGHRLRVFAPARE
jgi:catechol 2,3-dioxygenase-like lactoylglutathione lyase family enzyme